MLKDPNTPRLAFPLGVVSLDGKSLWTTHQGEVKGLEAVANDDAGRELWSLGALRAVLTSALAAPCLDMEFISAKQGELRQQHWKDDGRLKVEAEASPGEAQGTFTLKLWIEVARAP